MIYIALIIGISFLYLLFRVYLNVQRKKFERELETSVLRVAVSRLNERGPIVAEQIYAALHGIQENYSFWDYLCGQTEPRISLEIATIKNRIQFFIWSPRRFKNVIASQIYAQYPDVEIEEVADYSKQTFPTFEERVSRADVNQTSTNTGLIKYEKNEEQKYTAVTAELVLGDPDIYPIKRYPQFEDKLTRVATEPLVGITATLSKLNATDEQAWIQIVLQPVGDWWRKRGLKTIRIVNQGLFNNIFWLQDFATKMLLVRGFWKRFFLSPLFLVFWALRGFNSGSVTTN